MTAVKYKHQTCPAHLAGRSSIAGQEVQASIRSAQTLLRQEKKRRESLEKRFQKVQDERSELQVKADCFLPTCYAVASKSGNHSFS